MAISSSTSIVQQSVATTQEIYNITSPGTADTEFSQVLSTGTKQLLIQAVNGVATIKYTLVPGESGTDSITIPAGTTRHIFGINLTGATIHMQTDKISQDIEIEEWS